MSDRITSVTSEDDFGVIKKAEYDSLALVEETRVIAGQKYEADSKVAGEEVEGRRIEAGEEQLAKKELGTPRAKGSAEAEMYGEMGAQASGLASLEIAKTGYDLVTNNDPAAGQGVKTMEQDIKVTARKAPGLHLSDTKSKTGNTIKTPFIEDTADGLLGRAKMSKLFSNGFKAKNQTDKLSGRYVATQEEIGGFRFASLEKLAMAKKAGFEKTQELSAEMRATPQGPGGMGGQQFVHNGVAAPKGYVYPKDDTTDSESWVS